MKNKNAQIATNRKLWKTILYCIAFISLFSALTSCTADEIDTKKQPQNAEIDPPKVITKPPGH